MMGTMVDILKPFVLLLLLLLLLPPNGYAALVDFQRLPVTAKRLPCIPALSAIDVLNPYQLACPTSQSRPPSPRELLPRPDDIDVPKILQCLALYPAEDCSVSDAHATGAQVLMKIFQVCLVFLATPLRMRTAVGGRVRCCWLPLGVAWHGMPCCAVQCQWSHLIRPPPRARLACSVVSNPRGAVSFNILAELQKDCIQPFPVPMMTRGDWVLSAGLTGPNKSLQTGLAWDDLTSPFASRSTALTGY